MKNYVNIILGSGEWKYNHRKEFTKAIANEMQDVADTVVIDAPISLSINIIYKFKERLLKYFKGNFKPRKIDGRIWLFTPIILTHLFLWKKLKIFNLIDSLLLKFQIERFLKKVGIDKKRILWVYLPEHLVLAKTFPHHRLIYDSYDDNEYDYNGKFLKNESGLNKELVNISDLTLCVAKFTYDRFKLYSKNVIYLPNGNSYSAFEKNKSEPEENIINISKPVIGYLGTIRNWIDFKLIEYLLQNLKEYQLVFLGMISRNAKDNMVELKKHNNFSHIDFVEFSEVPSYVKSFNVGIIPFKINKFTLSVFPLKFFEYMATGIPIVTTSLPEMEGYSKYIGFSRTNEEFLKNCIDAVNGEFDEKVKYYSTLAERNSWKNRAAKLLKEINSKVLNINFGPISK